VKATRQYLGKSVTSCGRAAYTVASTTTNSLDADNIYEVDDSGYYRIEVEPVFSTEFKQEGQRLRDSYWLCVN
jgi:hypothetical protein